MSRLPAAKRREQLLDCAAELFSKAGYARATTAELARAAGVTEPIIYRHFKSKRDLFIALVERGAERTLAQWKQELRGAKDPAERLRRLLGDNPMVSAQGRDAYRVLLQSITEVGDPLIHEAVQSHMKNLHAFLTKEIAAAQAEHRVMRIFSDEIIAWLLIYIGLGYGILTAMKIDEHGTDRDRRHVQDVIARILVGRDRSRDDRDD